MDSDADGSRIPRPTLSKIRLRAAVIAAMRRNGEKELNVLSVCGNNASRERLEAVCSPQNFANENARKTRF